MRRNLAQSLVEHGEVRTTLEKAKEVRPFVERLITLARENTLRSRQRVIALLSDRAIISRENQEAYDAMSDARRRKVLVAKTGRRHRTGTVPAGLNKSKIPFVATGVVHKLFTDVAPRFADRPGGYTRIVRLADRRIGDNGRLALLQLVGTEEKAPAGAGRKGYSRRRDQARNRIRVLQGKGKPARRRAGKPAASAPAGDEPAAPAQSAET